ncbi:hypothetical protein NLO72_24820 [Pseudomonas tremae]|uniref:hypothetical protein n=1 Tax=Pseudomonas syringae group TaxID=136849 RepID=UPI000AD5C61E|nr:MULTISPECIES: hypothetical protein [Pseudomonas syringae group]MCQ2992423.1 hypothetical protein [Pseudomonas tremae]
MKIENLKDFSAKVRKSDFFDFLRNVDDWDSLLDRRDEDDFDASWVKNNEHVASAGYGAPTDESEITELREYVFKTVLRITNNSEAAGYISDDIGLLAEAFSKRRITTWLNDLLSSYLSGSFPH